MSLEKNIEIVEGIKVEKLDGSIKIVGPKGEITKSFIHPRIEIGIVNNKVVIKTNSKKKSDIAIVNTWSSHIKNMMLGVTKGYKNTLKIVYSHFPVTLEVKGKQVILKNFLGGKGDRTVNIIGETNVKIEKDEIVVMGINKEDVGQTAANIEQMCKRGKKDIRIFQDGLYLVNKEMIG